MATRRLKTIHLHLGRTPEHPEGSDPVASVVDA